MIETKVIQVANYPSTINENNRIWSEFGWSVLSVQVTHSQNTKTYTDGLGWYTGESTVETTTINYATITYQRDTAMCNYELLCKEENEFNRILNELNVASTENFLWTIARIGGIILCLIWGFASFSWENISDSMVQAFYSLIYAFVLKKVVDFISRMDIGKRQAAVKVKLDEIVARAAQIEK